MPVGVVKALYVYDCPMANFGSEAEGVASAWCLSFHAWHSRMTLVEQGRFLSPRGKLSLLRVNCTQCTWSPPQNAHPSLGPSLRPPPMALSVCVMNCILFIVALQKVLKSGHVHAPYTMCMVRHAPYAMCMVRHAPYTPCTHVHAPYTYIPRAPSEWSLHVSHGAVWLSKLERGTKK